MRGWVRESVSGDNTDDEQQERTFNGLGAFCIWGAAAGSSFAAQRLSELLRPSWVHYKSKLHSSSCLPLLFPSSSFVSQVSPSLLLLCLLSPCLQSTLAVVLLTLLAAGWGRWCGEVGAGCWSAASAGAMVWAGRDLQLVSAGTEPCHGAADSLRGWLSGVLKV